MTAAEYKKICNQPDVLTRSIINGTARLLPRSSQTNVKLQAILSQEPIPKPALHQDSNKWADHFQVTVSKAEADEIISTLLSAEAGAVSANGETTSYASFIADLVDSWANYHEFQGEENDVGSNF